MPGYTHLQRAQPVSLAFHLAAHAHAFLRDVKRLRQAADAADVSPLGAGALAGTTLPLDPTIAAEELGFSSTFDNAMDAVSDRDFAVELVNACSLFAVHASRFGGGDRPLDLVGVRVRPAFGLVVDGLEHDAAEAQPRHGRVDSWPGRRRGRRRSLSTGAAQGIAARIRPGPPGRQRDRVPGGGTGRGDRAGAGAAGRVSELRYRATCGSPQPARVRGRPTLPRCSSLEGSRSVRPTMRRGVSVARLEADGLEPGRRSGRCPHRVPPVARAGGPVAR